MFVGNQCTSYCASRVSCKASISYSWATKLHDTSSIRRFKMLHPWWLLPFGQNLHTSPLCSYHDITYVYKQIPSKLVTRKVKTTTKTLGDCEVHACKVLVFISFITIWCTSTKMSKLSKGNSTPSKWMYKERRKSPKTSSCASLL